MGNGFEMMGFGATFAVFQVMFFLVFGLVLTVFIVIAVKGISQWNKNNRSPRLTVPATVVAKRTNVSRHHHHGTGHAVHSGTSTSYYVTFQVSSGDRMELHVDGHEYGLLVEGDHGDLTFQGSRYLGFERKVRTDDSL